MVVAGGGIFFGISGGGVLAGPYASLFFVSFPRVSLGNAPKCTDDHPRSEDPPQGIIQGAGGRQSLKGGLGVKGSVR